MFVCVIGGGGGSVLDITRWRYVTVHFLLSVFVNLCSVFYVCRCFVRTINLDTYLCLYMVNF